MKSIFDQEAYTEIRNRLNTLSEDSERVWGKMTSGQMLHHCQAPLNIILEKEDYGFKPNWLVNLLFKKSMYNDRLWKKGLPTAKPLKETVPRDFTKEKMVLEDLLDELHSQCDLEEWAPHPAFGKFTKEQYGKMHYKHLDHHFRQFGV